MKKLLNNSGVTLVEMVAAVVILGIISIPLFNTIAHTVRMNSSSDEAIRMNAAIQKIIEEVKATGSHSQYKYYDKRFNEVASTYAYYTLELKTAMNTVQKNTDEYDRWDFDLILHSNGTVSLYNNNGIKVDSSGNYGKLYQSAQVFAPKAINSISIDFIGKKAVGGPYICKYGSASSEQKTFTPGNGKISAADNMIVLNVINEGRTSNFNLDVLNNTCYNNYDDEFYMKENSTEVDYHKHVVVNVFNDDSKVKINTLANYLDINYKSESSPHIINGTKIIVEVKNNKGKVVKTVNSVVARDVKIN